MIRSLIAFFVALFFSLASIVPPAYADTITGDDSSQVKEAQFSISWIKPEDVEGFINEVVRNSGTVIETVGSSIPSIEIKQEYIDQFIEEALRSSGAVIGAVGTPILICYTADGLATTVFPPAAALLPFCSQIGIVTGVTEAGTQIIRRVVPQIIR